MLWSCMELNGAFTCTWKIDLYPVTDLEVKAFFFFFTNECKKVTFSKKEYFNVTQIVLMSIFIDLDIYIYKPDLVISSYV